MIAKIGLRATPCALRFTLMIDGLRYALCALAYFEVTMATIAPIEDLRTAQKYLLAA